MKIGIKMECVTSEGAYITKMLASITTISSMMDCMALNLRKWGNFVFLTTHKKRTKKIISGMNALQP